MKSGKEIIAGINIGNLPTLGKQKTDFDERLDIKEMKKERIEKAKEQIKKAGLGAILCYDVANQRYLGVPPPPTWNQPRGSQYVLFPVTGEPIFFTRGTRISTIRNEIMESWGEKRVRGSQQVDWRIYGGLNTDIFYKEISDILDEYGVRKMPLGIDKPQYTINMKENFKKVGVDLVDAPLPMLAARLVKTQNELYCLNIAAGIAEKAFEAMRESIRPGIRECDVLAEAVRAAIQGGNDNVGEFICCSGERTNRNMLNFSDRQIRPGEIVFADIAGVTFLGYFTCYYRTFCCGKPSEKQKEMYAEALELLYDCMRAIKPGVTTSEIAEKFPTCDYWGMKSENEAIECFIAHGIGLSIHEPPAIHRMMLDNPIKLEENEVIAIETWVGGDNPREGVRIEEEFVITKDGVEVISKWPVDEITQCWI